MAEFFCNGPMIPPIIRLELMQENVESGVSEFERVKPKPVPGNWRGQEWELRRKKNREGARLQDEIGILELNDIAKKEEIIFHKEDLFQYFETLITVPDVMESWEGIIHYYRENPDGQLPETNPWGRLTTDFTSWWVHTHYDYMGWGMWKLRSLFKWCGRDALEIYLFEHDTEKAYGLINETYVDEVQRFRKNLLKARGLS